jgi:hypothetical protein
VLTSTGSEELGQFMHSEFQAFCFGDNYQVSRKNEISFFCSQFCVQKQPLALTRSSTFVPEEEI